MIDWLRPLVVGYPGLFLACTTAGIAMPVPEDVPVLFAGARIADGSAGWAPTLAVVLVGVLLRDVIAWAIGAVIGEWLLSRAWARRFIGERRLSRATTLVENHGGAAVLFARLLIGMRAPIYLVSGAMGLPLRRFLAWDVPGLVLVVPATLALGYGFGEPVVEAAAWVAGRTRALLGLTVLCAAAWLLWHTQRRAGPAGN